MPLSEILNRSRGELQAELQLILNAIVEGLCGVDPKNQVTFCNDALLRMTGYRSDELIGRNIHDAIHYRCQGGTPSSAEHCPLSKAVSIGEPFHKVAETLRRKDGSFFIAEYWAHPLNQAFGHTVSVLAFQDMTEREHALEALKSSEERFRQITNNIDQAFYLVDVIASHLVYASPAFEIITGISCHEAYKQPSPWRDLALPEDREKVLTDYQRLLEGEETKSEYRIRHRDGSTRWIRDCAKPIQDESGRVYMFTGVAEDITEIHYARAVLEQKEERFRRILASVADVAWTSDREGRSIYVSPKVQDVLGYTKREFSTGGSTLRLGLIHPGDFGRVHQRYLALFDQQLPFDEEYRIRRKDGTWIWIHDRANGLHEEDGIVYADGAFNDISARKKAEAELQWKTAFLEAQTNSTMDGMALVDPNGICIFANEKFIDLFPKTPEIIAQRTEHLLRYSLGLLRQPEMLSSMADYLNRHPTETARSEIETNLGVVLDLYSAPVIGEDNKYYGRIWTFRDITEQKKNEDMLRQLSMAVEQSPASVAITDPSGDISYVNRQFTEVTGYELGDALGKNLCFLDANVSSPESFSDLWSTISQGREWRGELCNRKKNGEIFWEAATVRPITNSKGLITHYVALKEDITERRRVEREFRLTQFSVEHASDAVEWIDSAGRLLYINQSECRALGRTREEILSLSVLDIDPLFTDERWSDFWRDLKAKGSMRFETQHKCKDGRTFPVEITATYLQFDGKEYCLAFVRDTSERRLLEGQLRQAQKLEGIGQLAAGIAHEINTPTQFVTDNLTFLSDSWKSTHELLEAYRAAIGSVAASLSPDVRVALEKAEQTCDLDFVVSEVPRAIDQSLDGARRVAEIVRAMKEFSHPDSAEKTATDLNRAVTSTITVARNEWKYVADVATRLDESLPLVECYPGEVNQVILNLVVNAAHAIKEKVKDGEKGKITVCTRAQGNFAEISVTDTGTGIPEEIRTRIFDPFFTTKEVGKGTGQGLSLAHAVVVKKHGGKIWFETETGRGTAFFIALPIEPAEQKREKP